MGANATTELNRFAVYLALPVPLFDIVANAQWQKIWLINAKARAWAGVAGLVGFKQMAQPLLTWWAATYLMHLPRPSPAGLMPILSLVTISACLAMT